MSPIGSLASSPRVLGFALLGSLALLSQGCNLSQSCNAAFYPDTLHFHLASDALRDDGQYEFYAVVDGEELRLQVAMDSSSSRDCLSEVSSETWTLGVNQCLEEGPGLSIVRTRGFGGAKDFSLSTSFEGTPLGTIEAENLEYPRYQPNGEGCEQVDVLSFDYPLMSVSDPA